MSLTTTIEVNTDTLTTLVNLVDLGVKAGGIRVVQPTALILPLLEQAQTDLNEQATAAPPLLDP